ncbi:MAG: phosphoribosylanthranilate isomerase [Candidatus Stahlbacteria bacterium]|nr:phosphoribosylanthranilate isomerase [Candidatus Stahlbacteria bacterium]
MTWIKICGITCLEDAICVAKSGADAIGFVFATDSPRRVTMEKAKTIISQLPESIIKVGVFVNEDAKIVKEIAKVCNLDMLQFHGEESPEYCDQFEIKVIKAFRISNEKSVADIIRYKVDFYLLDSFDKNRRGGSGKTFNWELALLVKKQGIPIILSGGLNEHNVKEAIRKVKPFGVDVSSGIEISHGKKEANKIQKFIESVRSELCII